MKLNILFFLLIWIIWNNWPFLRFFLNRLLWDILCSFVCLGCFSDSFVRCYVESYKRKTFFRKTCYHYFLFLVDKKWIVVTIFKSPDLVFRFVWYIILTGAARVLCIQIRNTCACIEISSHLNKQLKRRVLINWWNRIESDRSTSAQVVFLEYFVVDVYNHHDQHQQQH